MALGAHGRCHRSWDPQSPLLSAGAVDTGQPLSSLKPRLGLQVNPTLRATAPGPAAAELLPQLRPGDSFPRAPEQKPRLSGNHLEASKLRTWERRGGLEGASGSHSSREPRPPEGGSRPVRGRERTELQRPGVGTGGARALGAPTRLVQPAAPGKEPSRKRPSGYGLPLRPQGCPESHLFPLPGLPQDRRPTENLPSGPQGERRGAGPHRTHGPSPAPTLAPPAPTLAPVAR